MIADRFEAHCSPNLSERKRAVSAQWLRQSLFDASPPLAPSKLYLRLIMGSVQPQKVYDAGLQAAPRSTAWAICVSVPLDFERSQVS